MESQIERRRVITGSVAAWGCSLWRITGGVEGWRDSLACGGVALRSEAREAELRATEGGSRRFRRSWRKKTRE